MANRSTTGVYCTLPIPTPRNAGADERLVGLFLFVVGVLRTQGDASAGKMPAAQAEGTEFGSPAPT